MNDKEHIEKLDNELNKFEGMELETLLKDREYIKLVNEILFIGNEELIAKSEDILNGSWIASLRKNKKRGRIVKGKFIPEDEFIECLDSIIPTNYIISNNKLMNKLSSGDVEEGITELLVIDKPKKEVITNVSLNYDDDNIQISNKEKRFTPYDRTVHDAICSIFEAGNVNFTPSQVYRAMNGLDETEKVSPQAIGSVTKSIDKTRRMYVTIDLEDEAKLYENNIDKLYMEDHILSAKKMTLVTGAKEVTGYKFNSKPILYEYAQLSGQVLTIPSKILNTKALLRSTTEVIITREYLIRRIEVMKKNSNGHQSNRIRLDAIYEEIENKEPTKQKAQKIRENTEKLLESFKDKEYIKGYNFYKKGRIFEGVEIFR